MRIRNVLTLMFLIYLGLFYTQKINFTTADLGRHLQNGKIFLKTFKPLDTNFYSYTESDFKVINHHWGAGVIFYLIYKFAGFNGLSLFYVLLSIMSVIPLLYLSIKKSNVYIAILSFIISVPLITDRTEIRPEVFTFLFTNLFFLLLYKYSEGTLKQKFVFPALIILQTVWVNLHILFILGPIITLLFLVTSLTQKRRGLAKSMILLLVGLAAATLFNPFGIQGALAPLSIFNNYGYRIVENQSIFFLQRILPRFLYFHFEVLVFIFAQLVIYFGFFKRRFFLENMIFILTGGFFGILSFLHMRELPFFGGFFSLFLAVFIYELIQGFPLLESVKKIIGGLAVVIMLGSLFSSISRNFGIGLQTEIQKSAEFFKANNLRGPIFNNYDIGGYLIFNLYPKEKVFVDNRPEAYSSNFLQQIYISMQEDNKIWKENEEKYKFNVIYFYRHDYTPWGQKFLVERIKDPEWAPVYVDDYTIILLKRSGENLEFIQKYELPKSEF